MYKAERGQQALSLAPELHEVPGTHSQSSVQPWDGPFPGGQSECLARALACAKHPVPIALVAQIEHGQMNFTSARANPSFHR